MTERLTPAYPAVRAALFAAYAAAHETADHLDLDVQDDRITQAALDASTPLIQALTLRSAADEATAWSGVGEWLRQRADAIEATGERKAAERRGRLGRERTNRQIIITVTDVPEETP